MVFVPERYWLTLDEEKATYDLHENNSEDQGYRQFLSRLSVPLLTKLKANRTGLDFGCGPGPTLSTLFEEQGHAMDLYDPFYYHDLSVFEKTYDFICATEVVEHLRNPAKDWAVLFNLLKPGGWLGIMTKQVIDKQAFRTWHYIRDLTHVCFYNESAFSYVAQHFHVDVQFVAKDVILFNKKE